MQPWQLALFLIFKATSWVFRLVMAIFLVTAIGMLVLTIAVLVGAKVGVYDSIAYRIRPKVALQ